MINVRKAQHILIKLEFFAYIFEESSNTKFDKDPSSGSQVVPCGQTDGWPCGQTDITKQIAAFTTLQTYQRSGRRNVAIYEKVKQSRYRPGVAQRVPGS